MLKLVTAVFQNLIELENQSLFKRSTVVDLIVTTSVCPDKIYRCLATSVGNKRLQLRGYAEVVRCQNRQKIVGYAVKNLVSAILESLQKACSGTTSGSIPTCLHVLL